MEEHIKKFKARFLTYLLPNSLKLIIAPVTLYYYSHALSPKDFGAIAIVYIFIVFLRNLSNFGIINGMIRFYYDMKDKIEQQKLINTAYLSTTILAFLAIVATLLFIKYTFAINFFSGIKNNFFLLIIASIILLCEMQVTVVLSLFKIQGRALNYILIESLNLLLGAILGIYLVYFLHLGVLGFFLANLMTLLTCNLIINFKYILSKKLYFSMYYFKKMFSYGYPYVFIFLSYWFIDWSDRFFLKYLTNLSEVGLYHLGYSFAMYITIVLEPFASAFYPILFNAYKRKEGNVIYSKYFTYFVYLAVFFYILLNVIALYYFKLLTPVEFHSAINVIPLVLIAYCLMGATVFFSIGIQKECKISYQLKVMIAGAVSNVILNILLIPHFGRMGAALATLITYLIVTLGLFIKNCQIYPVEFEFNRISKILIVGLLLLYICFKLDNLLFWTSITSRGFLIIIFPILLYFVGFYKKEEIEKMKNWFLKIKSLISVKL